MRLNGEKGGRSVSMPPGPPSVTPTMGNAQGDRIDTLETKQAPFALVTPIPKT